MTRTITALYDTYDAAQRAVSALEASGVPSADISIVANNSDNWRSGDKSTNEAAQDGGTGAGLGAVVGGVGGLLTGLGLIAIPGVGPVVAAGWLISTVAGAAAGAVVGGAAGGLVGALTSAGVPENEAHVYAEGVRRGGTLVSARVDDARADQARLVLDQHKSIDVNARGDVYRKQGWSTFDPKAPSYTADEVRKERTRYGAGI